MRIQQRVSWIDYGEGYVEGSWGLVIPREATCVERGKSKNRKKNIERATRRAKAQVRRKCMAGGFDHLLTLTMRQNITDKERAVHYLQRFERKMHQYIPDWKYVCTIERQKRGSIHFHLGVKGFQDVQFLRSVWRSIVGEGNVDVQYVKSKKGLTWRKARLASYLAKYINKEMETELNERRFRASPGIVIPEVTVYMPLVIKGKKLVPVSAKQYLLEHIRYLAGRVGFIWESAEGHGQYGWACSWG